MFVERATKHLGWKLNSSIRILIHNDTKRLFIDIGRLVEQVPIDRLFTKFLLFEVFDFDKRLLVSKRSSTTTALNVLFWVLPILPFRVSAFSTERTSP